MTEPVFLIALAMAATTVVIIARTVAGAISGRQSSRELAELRDQVDRHAAALEDAQAQISSQNGQLAELHERVDFAERLLAQNRDRQALGPGDQR